MSDRHMHPSRLGFGDGLRLLNMTKCILVKSTAYSNLQTLLCFQDKEALNNSALGSTVVACM